MEPLCCKFCKQIFSFKKTTKTNLFYCSRDCYNLDHWKINNCVFCFKQFAHHKTKKRLFCSISCSNKARYEQKIKICKFCNKSFKAMNCKRKNIFCSTKCYNNSGQRKFDKFREKNPLFIKGKFSYRKFALRELPNECAICKSINRLDAHHIDEDRDNNELHNLIILCHTCHLQYHHNKLDLS